MHGFTLFYAIDCHCESKAREQAIDLFKDEKPTDVPLELLDQNVICQDTYKVQVDVMVPDPTKVDDYEQLFPSAEDIKEFN